MQVVFNVLQFKDISKRQMISYVKKYKLDPQPTVLDKTKCAMILADHCIKQKFVRVGCELDHDKSDRAKIQKVKAF